MASPRRCVLALVVVLGSPLLVSAPAAQREPILLIPAPSATAMGALPLSRQGALAHFRARLAADREMSIIVEVRVPALPVDGAAASGQAMDETRVIAEVQRRVIRRLPPQLHEVREYEVIPFIALVADARTFEILLSDSDVVSIQEDFAVPPALADSVPLVQATVAWGKGYTGRGITVAVLDSGVEKKHAIFRDGIIAEACYSGGGKKSNSLCRNGALASTASGSAAPCTYNKDQCGHGTHVAAIAAGYTGVAPAAWIIAMQVFSKADGKLWSHTSDMVKALERVYTLRTKYSIASVNMSIGGDGYTKTCDSQSRAMVSIVKKLYDERIAVVVSSGNDSYYNGISYPACLSQVVSVGNATKSNKVNSSSNAASFLRLLAPGTDIRAAVPGGSYGYKTGTSMAAPHVAGAWAILVQKTPSLTVAAGLSALRSTGLNIVDSRNKLTFKRIRINNALNKLKALARTTLGTPSGTNSAAKPKYTWSRVAASTHYRLWVEVSGSNKAVINTWYRASDVCSSRGCSVTPSVALRAGSTYKWYVQTYEVRVGPWSAGKTFVQR